MRPAAALACFLLAACVHSLPAPTDLPARTARAASATLDIPRAAALAQAVAPRATPDPAAPDRLTLLAALVLYDPRVAQARAALVVALREAGSARHVAAPSLSLTGQYSNDPTTEPWQGGLSASLPLDHGGLRKARLTRADLAVLIARDDLAETIWAERMAARAALIDIYTARRHSVLLMQVADLRTQALAAAQARARAGESPGQDVDTARILLHQAIRVQEDARAAETDARARIAAILGVARLVDSTIDVTWADFATPAPFVAPDAATRQRAVAARFDVLRAVATYDQTDADVRAEIARQYPQITLGPAFIWSGGPVTLPFSLGLQLPPWDGNHAAIRAALARRDAAGVAIQASLSGALNAITKAEAECIAARAALAHVRDGEWAAAQASATRAQNRLNHGEIARLDWVLAQVGALDARNALEDAIARVQRADAALEDALHRPIAGPETLIERPWPEIRPEGEK